MKQKQLISTLLIIIAVSVLLFTCDAPGIPDKDINTEIPKIDDTIRIWTIGDSITEGTNNGYRNNIWTLLAEKGNTVDFIGTLQHNWPIGSCPDPDHDGHPGWSIGNVAAEIDDMYGQVQEQNPEIALIMLGTNNLAWWVSGQDFVDSRDESMMDLVEHLFELDGSLIAIVGTIPPMESKNIEQTGQDRADYTRQYNEALINKIENHPFYMQKLFLADINGALTVSDLSDGIHPNSQGYDKMGKIWTDAISVYLNISTLNSRLDRSHRTFYP
jgi:lysophospholipase L1-like esterase